MKTMTETEKRHEFEKKIKKSKNYVMATRKFINLSDKQGKTALHYAANHGSLELV